jgi:hypothetical protein
MITHAYFLLMIILNHKDYTLLRIIHCCITTLIYEITVESTTWVYSKIMKNERKKKCNWKIFINTVNLKLEKHFNKKNLLIFLYFFNLCFGIYLSIIAIEPSVFVSHEYSHWWMWFARCVFTIYCYCSSVSH